MLDEAKIRLWLLVVGSSILFVLKNTGNRLYLYVDYRQLNKIIIKDRTLIVLINKLLVIVAGTIYLIRLDIKKN